MFMASISQAVSVALLRLRLQLCYQKVFLLSDETYCGGHVSFSTNISALIKHFSISEVSDCERHTRVREASLSVM